PETLGDVKPTEGKEHANVIDAAAAGAAQGMQLAINIAAMLIAFIAFIYLFDKLLELLSISVNWALELSESSQRMRTLSLRQIFSWVFSPVAVLMGCQGDDVPKMGELL